LEKGSAAAQDAIVEAQRDAAYAQHARDTASKAPGVPDEKGEAERQAQTDAERTAYEAEVSRLKAAHQERLKIFRKDQELYTKALADYQQVKTETIAARKLIVARSLYEDALKRDAEGAALEASKLMAFAKKRFQEITALYPETLAAKDAKSLLNGEKVARRNIPIEPTPPEQPVAPDLTLPPAPSLRSAAESKLRGARDIGWLSAWRVGDYGTCDSVPWIIQVVPPDRVLLGNPSEGASVMLRVGSAAGLVDGARFSFKGQLIRVTGTTTYRTVIGGTKTVLTADLLDP
jgi:hypothetical protein